eukprot:m.15011 g.15011  ORF g.15011 m.15011 type:complete len:216 (-) comp5265_c0_seq2:110-757(-)
MGNSSSRAKVKRSAIIEDLEGKTLDDSFSKLSSQRRKSHFEELRKAERSAELAKKLVKNNSREIPQEAIFLGKSLRQECINPENNPRTQTLANRSASGEGRKPKHSVTSNKLITDQAEVSVLIQSDSEDDEDDIDKLSLSTTEEEITSARERLDQVRERLNRLKERNNSLEVHSVQQFTPKLTKRMQGFMNRSVSDSAAYGAKPSEDPGSISYHE